MRQLTFGVVDDACLADIRNRILAVWRVSGYDNGYHKANSLDKHLGVRKLSECVDIDELVGYLNYVEGKSAVSN